MGTSLRNMIRVFTAGDIVVSLDPLAAEEVISGEVFTGEMSVDAVGHLEVGVWDHSVGVSTATEIDEVFVVISGRGRVRDDQGSVIELRAGVVGVLSAGAHTTWEIYEPLRKVWVTTG
jgi:uncharacterized cupin superfamily protein